MLSDSVAPLVIVSSDGAQLMMAANVPRAQSTAARASLPSAYGLDGLPNRLLKNGIIASSTR